MNVFACCGFIYHLCIHTKRIGILMQYLILYTQAD